MSSQIPEYFTYEEFVNRSKKVAELRALGIDPYPYHFSPTYSAQQIEELFREKDVGHSDDAASGSTPQVLIAGRLVLFRPMGKNVFGHIQDSSGRIQVMCNRDVTQVENYDPQRSPEALSHLKFIEKKIDLGDILGVEGYLFRTQKGELTIFVKKMTLLCKSLLPLPDKHSGLVDKGILYRKRWLDLITHKDSVERFHQRTKILQIIRNYLEEAGFMEVETPVLQNVYGGAQAKPFTTMLNALHQEMFLRISLEIPLKKLIIGGLSKVFEIGKVFRNEGIDRTHNPEFTELEAYAAYWDYNDLMVFVENLFQTVALKLLGTTQIPLIHEGEQILIDVKAPWKRITMKESILHYASIDVNGLPDDQIRSILSEKTSIDPKVIKESTRGSLIAFLFEEFVESHLIQPHHITDHPIETTPLCKLHRDPQSKGERLVERFESFIGTSEMTNAYTELNDPELQRQLLQEQAAKKLAGNEEANPMDEEFLEAICQGMPPTGGFGIGVDRLVMLFTQAASIRDVLFFPLMRPEE